MFVTRLISRFPKFHYYYLRVTQKLVPLLPLDNKFKFTLIYFLNLWGSPDSVSGPGSTLEYTAPLRRKLPQLFAELQISVCLDAPCGDFSWMRSVVANSHVKYIGGDIVPALIRSNLRNFANEKCGFRLIDITSDDLPEAGCLIVRDLFIHLSDIDIQKVFQNYLRANIRFLALNHYPLSPEVIPNDDIPTGSFRYINFYSAPWNLSAKPIASLRDYVPPFPIRTFEVFHRKDIEERQKTILTNS